MIPDSKARTVPCQIGARRPARPGNAGLAERPRGPGFSAAIWALAAGAAALLSLFGPGCHSPRVNPPEWMAWRARRTEAIAGTNGWTTLVARHWLTEGPNFAGSDPTNHAVLPRGRAPANVGVFVRQGRRVRFDAAPRVVATVDGRVVRGMDLVSDQDGAPTLVRVGDLTFVVIERGERLGLRVRDPEAPDRRWFAGLRCFPYAPAWRIEGRFEPFPEPRTLRVADVAGGTQEFPSPGALVFRHAGDEYRLDVAEESPDAPFLVLFRDATSGRSTYGAGRFLTVERPGPDRRVEIDFNRAYTPPCGFTPFATCPLPPGQNSLPFEVRAGERKPAGHD